MKGDIARKERGDKGTNKAIGGEERLRYGRKESRRGGQGALESTEGSGEMAPPSSRSKTQQDSKAKLDKWIGGEEGNASQLERLFKEMENMRNQMERMRESIKESLEDKLDKIRIELEEERGRREEERKREREEWRREKGKIEQRIEEIERTNERRERENRKKNIVIKGASWEGGRVEEEVCRFVKENLRTEVTVERAYKIKVKENKEIVVASLGSWEQKREIMYKKKELSQGIWIEDDLTKEERGIQIKLRERAREEREKGNKVKVGYMKLFIGDKVFRWNERRKELEDGRRKD